MLKIGERGSGFRPRAGEVQDFEILRDQCLQQGALFEDPDFDTVDSSLFYSKAPDKPFKWLRPSVSIFSLFIFMYKFSNIQNLFLRKSQATHSYSSKELHGLMYSKENWVINEK